MYHLFLDITQARRIIVHFPKLCFAFYFYGENNLGCKHLQRNTSLDFAQKTARSKERNCLFEGGRNWLIKPRFYGNHKTATRREKGQRALT